jgi:hypothetical protein
LFWFKAILCLKSSSPASALRVISYEGCTSFARQFCALHFVLVQERNAVPFRKKSNLHKLYAFLRSLVVFNIFILKKYHMFC